jgi:hypothetical protein
MRTLAQLFTLGFCAAAVSACSGAGSGTVSLGTSAQCIEQPSCCDSSGNFNASLCTTAAGAPSVEAANQASKAAQSVADAGTNSSNGAQTSSGDASGKTLSQAATAALGTAPSGINPASVLASTAGTDMAAPLTSTGSGSAAGTTPGSSSGGSNLTGTTTTANAAEAPTSGTTAIALDEGVGGAESIGNVSRAGGRGGDNGMSNPFGSLMDAFSGKTPAARTPAEIAFKGEVDPQSGKPTAGTSDPADYFNRLTSDDNLFKVIERRYQKQAMTWAKQN